MSMSSSSSARETVVGVFHNSDHAREAIEALKDAGFKSNEIGLLMADQNRAGEMARDTGVESHAGSGAATGAVTGGILGGIGGWLVGIGALAIPGVGPFIAAGAFATALGGAAIGAGVGAVAGALVGMGVPKEEADYYEGEVRGGRTLVTVQSAARYAEAQRILRDHGAYDIETRDRAEDGYAQTGSAQGDYPQTGYAETGATGTTGRDQQTMQLREEQLEARKQPVETGQVSVGKRVVEEQRSIDVPVTREEVFVDRRPVDRPAADRPIDTSGQTIDVPVREERVDVSKQPVVYEEVGVGKRQVTEQQRVSDTVRREEARVEGEGDVQPQTRNP